MGNTGPQSVLGTNSENQNTFSALRLQTKVLISLSALFGASYLLFRLKLAGVERLYADLGWQFVPHADGLEKLCFLVGFFAIPFALISFISDIRHHRRTCSTANHPMTRSPDDPIC